MGLAHNPKVSMDGLICYIDPANPRCYQGTSSYLDLSGNGNDMSLLSGTYDSTNKWIESTTVNGTDYLQASMANSTTINNTFSVTSGGWAIEEIVRIDDTTYPEAAAGTTISGPAYNAGQVGFDWNHGEYLSTGYIDIGMSDGSQSSGYGQRISLQLEDKYKNGGWMHRYIYWNRSAQKVGVWYNGKFQSEGTITVDGSFYDGGGLSIGTLYGWQHDGARSIFRIYNRLLSDDEIVGNFNATKSRFGL